MARTFFKKVIVAVNGRLSSIHASMYAIMMARTYNLSLKFVYVVDTATIKYLTMNKLLAASKGVKADTELRNGGVFTEIIKVAEEYESDLILLGGREKGVHGSTFKKNVLSKDENEVLVNASCPVMIVQKPDIESLFKIF